MKERISALMDGELDDRAAAQAIEALVADGEGRDAWRTYHVIGDALRANPLLSEGFTARVAQRLAEEPTVLAPKRPRAQPRTTWYALAASAAGVALVGWLAFAPQPQRPVAPVAKAPPAAAARVATSAAKPPVLPLPTATPDYLLAHQGYSPRVFFQGMAPYVRTVSEQVQESSK